MRQRAGQAYHQTQYMDAFRNALTKLDRSLLDPIDWSIVDYIYETGKLSPVEAAIRYREIKEIKSQRLVKQAPYDSAKP